MRGWSNPLPRRAVAIAVALPVLMAVAAPVMGPAAAASQGAPPSASWAELASSPAVFAPFVAPDTDLLLLPAARRPSPRPVVVAATRVAARAADVTTVVLTPALLRQALPALVRADVVSTRPGPRPDGWPDRLLDWEVEVPLFNLKGKGWLQQRPGGAELTLVEGAFAPGTIRFRVAPAGAAYPTTTASILTSEVQLEVRSSNWIFRKVARHDPWAETAMSAAISWVVSRAIALRAEAPPGGAPARPTTPIQAPAAAALDGAPLAHPALAALRGAGRVASVRRAPSGRLAWTSMVIPADGKPEALSARLGSPENWAVFPGWKSVKRRPPPKAATSTPALVIAVEDDVSLVDLDAVWAVQPGPPVRATVIDGDTRGGVLAWQVSSEVASKDSAPAGAVAPVTAAGALAVLSLHPRLDAAGFIERRLVAAEPLLEHALALALTYVYAAAMADELAASNARPQRQTPTPE